MRCAYSDTPVITAMNSGGRPGRRIGGKLLPQTLQACHAFPELGLAGLDLEGCPPAICKLDDCICFKTG